MAQVLVDTGILYALADADDTWHEPAKLFVKANADALVVPVTVLPEACYLVNTYLGREAERSLLASVAMGELNIESLAAGDFRRILEILEVYADADIGFVDASVVAVAERLKIRRVLTTDRRHFSFIRPRHCPSFELLP